MTDVSSLPLLPHEVGATVRCSAVTTRVGNRMMLALPYRAGFGPSRGRRYRITVNGERTGSQLVMVVNEQATVPVSADSTPEGEVVEVTVRVLAQRPSVQVPPDFSAALATQCLGLDLLADHEVNQLITMIREADDPEIRRARVENAVEAVADLVAVRSGRVDDR